MSIFLYRHECELVLLILIMYDHDAMQGVGPWAFLSEGGLYDIKVVVRGGRHKE